MRSGKLRAVSDYLVKQMCKDDNYKILESGKILTLITKSGKKSVKGIWREVTIQNKGGCGRRKKTYSQVNYKKKKLMLHRIMFQKFIGELSDDLMINHIDGNTTNNSLNNLELITQSENNKHRFRELKTGAVKGNAKINQEIADNIRRDRKVGLTYKELMSKYNLGKTNISYIVNNKIWVNNLEII